MLRLRNPPAWRAAAKIGLKITFEKPAVSAPSSFFGLPRRAQIGSWQIAFPKTRAWRARGPTSAWPRPWRAAAQPSARPRPWREYLLLSKRTRQVFVTAPGTAWTVADDQEEEAPTPEVCGERIVELYFVDLRINRPHHLKQRSTKVAIVQRLPNPALSPRLTAVRNRLSRERVATIHGKGCRSIRSSRRRASRDRWSSSTLGTLWLHRLVLGMAPSISCKPPSAAGSTTANS
jgi:hypothetical protein